MNDNTSTGRPMKQFDASLQTLVGIVTPCAWDESDRVSGVSLSATDDEEYVIENGERFMSLLQKQIRAVGLVRKGTALQRAITIKQFEMLESGAFAE